MGGPRQGHEVRDKGGAEALQFLVEAAEEGGMAVRDGASATAVAASAAACGGRHRAVVAAEAAAAATTATAEQCSSAQAGRLSVRFRSL